MAKTTGSELAAQSETNKPQIKKVARTAFAAVISAGLVGTFALPAYANLGAEEVPVVAANQAPQVLTTVEAEGLDVQVPAALAVVEDEELLERERLEAEREAERQAEEELRQRLLEEATHQQAQAAQIVATPSGATGNARADRAAAMVGSGYGWDCTMLVEHAIGTNFDLGTGYWQYAGAYGTLVHSGSVNAVPYDLLQPGDILIYGNLDSGGHVAIYHGNGVAIHGGYGPTVVSAGVTNPYPFISQQDTSFYVVR